MQIKSRKTIFIIVIILAAIFFIKMKFWPGTNTKEIIKEVKPKYGSIVKAITTTGNVQPQNRLEMKSPIGGRVDQILVEEGQMVKTGDILAYLSSTDRAALLDAAKPQGQEAVAYWEDVYKPTPIIASIDGEVIVKSVQPGQTVTTTDDIVVLSDRLIVEGQVDETDIGKVKEGQKSVITLDAYPDMKVDAKVGHIYYESKLVNNVTIYNVDIIPDKVPDVFRSGMSANVTIVQESKENILLIPLETVKSSKNGEGSFVFVSQGKGKKPEKRKVDLGISDDSNVEVISGIDENDTLVVRSKPAGAPSKAGQPKTNPFMPGGGRR